MAQHLIMSSSLQQPKAGRKDFQKVSVRLYVPPRMCVHGGGHVGSSEPQWVFAQFWKAKDRTFHREELAILCEIHC